jgi:hypothetical protein
MLLPVVVPGAVLVLLPGVVLLSALVSRRLHAPSDAAAASVMMLIDASRTRFMRAPCGDDGRQGAADGMPARTRRKAS